MNNQNEEYLICVTGVICEIIYANEENGYTTITYEYVYVNFKYWYVIFKNYFAPFFFPTYDVRVFFSYVTTCPYKNIFSVFTLKTFRIYLVFYL